MHIAYYYPAPFPTLDADIVNIVQMCRAFTALGHEVTLFIPKSDKFAYSESAMQEAYALFGAPLGFNLVFLSRHTIMGRLQMLGSLWSAKKAMSEHVLELIYTRAPWACLRLPFQKIPFIFEAHEVELHKESKLLSKIMQRIIVWASKRQHCRRVVVISAALGKVWRELGISPHKISVAHDAVDLALFSNTITKTEARAKTNVSTNRPVIVYTGSLYPDRGINLIVKAARQLPDAEFILVGGAKEDVERVRQEINQLKIQNIRLIGQVPHQDIPHWLAVADILLMMWTWQVKTIAICSPMKLFEYMAAERLIVGPAFPTIKEVVTHNEHAILFEPDNLDQLVAALRIALDTYQNSPMPALARELVAQHYTWEQRCRDILEDIFV